MEPKNTLLNFLILIAIALPILLLDRIGSPTERGFFKDDDSLSYPYRSDTVPNWLLYTVGFGLPIALIILDNLIILKMSGQNNVFERLKHSFQAIILYLLGAAACQLQVAICKYTVGRLRPHFFDVCQPEFSIVENQTTPSYIMNYTFQGNGNLFSDDIMKSKIKSARLSFPSGHSSFAFQAATFTVFYLQTKFITKPKLSNFQQKLLLVPFLQVITISIATFTAVSRIMDYKHHPTDVLTGALIGIVSQSLNVYAVIGCWNGNEPETKEAIDKDESNNPLLSKNTIDEDQRVTHRRRRRSYDSIVLNHV